MILTNTNPKQLQKMGGVAALIEAITFIIGFALYLTLLESARYGSLDIPPTEHAAFLVENQMLMYAWNLIIYVVFGIFLVVLTLALHKQLAQLSSPFVPIATTFGLIWSVLVIASGMIANIGASLIVNLYATDPIQAGNVWLSMSFVTNGLGGGNEIVGGIWVLLISWVALKGNVFPKGLNYLGLIVSISGILTTIPPLAMLGAIFGFGLIVWFVWIGVVLLSNQTNLLR